MSDVRDTPHRASRGNDNPTFSGGVLAGAIGHLVVAAWILAAFATARTPEERGTSAMPAYIEVFLTPGVFVLALVRSFDKSTRARAGGQAIGNLSGLLAVAVVALMVRRRSSRRGGSCWREADSGATCDAGNRARRSCRGLGVE